MPAAASTPAWRQPPPSSLRSRRARKMELSDPHSIEPTGAPSPLLRQNCTVSATAAKADSGTPAATDAFTSRAPSRCTDRPWRRASAAISASSSTPATRPPAIMNVFSRQSSRGGGLCGSTRFGGIAAARVSGSIRPPAPSSGRVTTPQSAEAAPASCETMCESRWAYSSSPCVACTRIASWFAIVPETVKSAASVPANAATRRSSSITVGSSPYTSSPTTADAIASRMPAVGRVTVSERRSTGGRLMRGESAREGRG